MSKYSSFKEHQLITENWRKFLAEGSDEVANEGLFGFNSPEGILGTGAWAKSKADQGTGFSQWTKGNVIRDREIEKYGRDRFDRIIPALANLLDNAPAELLRLLKSRLHPDYSNFMFYRQHTDKKSRAGQKKHPDSARAARGGAWEETADELDRIADDLSNANYRWIENLNKIEKDLFGQSTKVTNPLDANPFLRAALDHLGAKPLDYDSDPPIWVKKPPAPEELEKDVDWDE